MLVYLPVGCLFGLQKEYWGGMDWINLAQDRDRWRTFMNAVINLSVQQMRGILWLAEELSASQEGLCSMKLVG